MDYATLSLAELKTGLEAIGQDAQTTFGGFDARQLNWRPDATRWSVAQCLEHLLIANSLMLRAAADALDDARPRTLWQKMPILPGVLGPILIRSQAPAAARKFKTAATAEPSASDIGSDVVRRFVEQQRELAMWLGALDERRAARAIMTSPFARVITYSVLDGCRLVLAHGRRHFEQACRVTASPVFPGATPPDSGRSG